MLQRILGAVCLTTLMALPLAGQNQDNPAIEETIFVFLDCNTRACDYDHFRREISWVNWVNVQEDSDVHLLITAQQTGGNGWRYTLDLIGRNAFEGEEKTSTHTSDRTDSDTEVRDGITEVIKRALFHFVEETPIIEELQIVHRRPRVGLQVSEQNDPWNLWVFRISGDGTVEAEAGQEAFGIGSRLSADRVTPDFKFGFDFFGDYEKETYDLEEGDTYSDTSEEYTIRLQTVWSLTSHWSAGIQGAGNRSTFYNRDLSASGGPNIEYNFFPYSESTRRSVTLRYGIEPIFFDYTEMTVESKETELLTRHNLVLSAAVQQPWGTIFGSIEGIQYLNDLETHRINTYFNLEYRLFRGFTLDMRGRFSRIKDQFYLAAEGNTIEEILLQRQQRETSWEYDIRFGITYQFGSKFANVVNPRMGSGMRFFR